MSNILLVDWDMFFPNPMGASLAEVSQEDRQNYWLYDWSHRESEFFINMVWGTRAEAFLRNDVPLPVLNGKQRTFWDRFTFTPDAQVFYADSNCYAAAPEVVGDQDDYIHHVWLYDAHHDSGYTQGEQTRYVRRKLRKQLLNAGLWGCDNYMVLYDAVGAKLHVRYPTWKPWALTGEPHPLVRVDRKVDDEQPNKLHFNRIFVCRSGAWVPPWEGMDQQFLDFVDACPVQAEPVCLQPGGVDVREWDVRQVLEETQRNTIRLRELYAQSQKEAVSESAG